MGAKVKPWTCDNGHILGLVRSKSGDGYGKELMLYRNAIDLQADIMTEVQVISTIQEVSTILVTCDVCDKTREWNPSQEAMDSLVGRVVRLRQSGR